MNKNIPMENDLLEAVSKPPIRWLEPFVKR